MSPRDIEGEIRHFWQIDRRRKFTLENDRGFAQIVEYESLQDRKIYTLVLDDAERRSRSPKVERKRHHKHSEGQRHAPSSKGGSYYSRSPSSSSVEEVRSTRRDRRVKTEERSPSRGPRRHFPSFMPRVESIKVEPESLPATPSTGYQSTPSQPLGDTGATRRGRGFRAHSNPFQTSYHGSRGHSRAPYMQNTPGHFNTASASPYVPTTPFGG